MAFAAAVIGLDPPSADVAEPPATEEPDAEESSRVAEAQVEFERGVALFESGDLAEALAAFLRAYEIEPHSHLFYNIGVVQLEMGDHAAATRSLRRYLDESGDTVSARRRSEVEKHLDALSRRVARLTVRSNVDGAQVMIDGEVVGTSPLRDPIVLNPGTRRVHVSAPGYAASSQAIILAGGQDRVVEAELELQQPPPPVVVDTQERHEVRRLEISAYVLLGLTVAAGAGTIATGVLAMRADDDLARELDMFPADPQAVAGARDRRQTLVATSNALVATTAVLAAATIATGVAALVLARAQRGERMGRRARANGLVFRF